MSDLKSFLWNNQTATSTKSRYKHLSFQLTEWPDFGHVGCPGDYIVLSAYLMNKQLSFSELTALTSCDLSAINHYLYVCKMLQIIEVYEYTEAPQSSSGLKAVSSILGQKLKSLFLHQASRMINQKVAFIGSVGSGKSTLIKNLSNVDMLDTDVDSSVDIGKQTTTVGIDYGEIKIDDQLRLGLYGVPGQRKFSLLWDFVKQGLWGLVILVKNNDTESLDELTHLLEYFEIDGSIPCLVGVTHTDTSQGGNTRTKIKSILKDKGLKLPVYSIDGRKKTNAELVFKTLIMLDETNHLGQLSTA